MSQTDIECAGVVWVFKVTPDSEDPEVREAYKALWLNWLRQWNPPDEWLQ
jgi:hypothetical protein